MGKPIDSNLTRKLLRKAENREKWYIRMFEVLSLRCHSEGPDIFCCSSTRQQTIEQCFFIKHKSDVCEKLKEFNKLVYNEYGHSIKTLRADNGREYVNNELQKYAKGLGIKLETTASYTPQQNGKAEHENRTIVESARTMLQASDLSVKLWTEAINTAVYILNRTAIKKGKSETPFEAWNKKKLELSHVRVFGAEAYSYIDKQFRKKMDKKAQKLMLVGYQAESTNYRLWDPETSKIIISRNVVFNEKSVSKL